MRFETKKNTIEFEVSGRYAMFSDPVFRVGGEKFSYPIPTYEALKGIASAIYWKPTFTWFIDDVRVMNQIITESKGILRPAIVLGGGKKQLDCYTYLKNVKYQVRAHFEWNKNRPDLQEDRIDGKHYSIAKRALQKGGRRSAFLGTRECQADVVPCSFGEGESFYDHNESFENAIRFGLMYHGITYPDERENINDEQIMTVNFWNPEMKDGVIHFCRPSECFHKTIRHENQKEFVLSRNIKPVAQEEADWED